MGDDGLGAPQISHSKRSGWLAKVHREHTNCSDSGDGGDEVDSGGGLGFGLCWIGERRPSLQVAHVGLWPWFW